MQNSELILEITKIPDWNCLMLVVEKIEKKVSRFIIRGNTVVILDFDTWDHEFRRKTKIQAVYKAIVEFIKWYNKEGK